MEEQLKMNESNLEGYPWEALPDSWTYDYIVEQSNKGIMRYDHVAQRDLVWDNDQKSLLIATIIEKCPRLEAISVNKTGGYIFVIDGKQRNNAVIDFVNNKFKLTGIAPIVYRDSSNKIATENINKKSFSELSVDLQKRILGSVATVHVYTNVSIEGCIVIFNRINNGRALTSLEKNSIFAVSLDKFNTLTNHEFFAKYYSRGGKANRTNKRGAIMKTWSLLYSDYPTFSNKKMGEYASKNALTDEQYAQLTKIFDRFLNALNALAEDSDYAAIKNFSIKSTHFPYVSYVINKSIEDGKTISLVANWLKAFVLDDSEACIEYRKMAQNGTAKPKSIKQSKELILSHYNDFVNNS